MQLTEVVAHHATLERTNPILGSVDLDVQNAPVAHMQALLAQLHAQIVLRVPISRLLVERTATCAMLDHILILGQVLVLLAMLANTLQIVELLVLTHALTVLQILIRVWLLLLAQTVLMVRVVQPVLHLVLFLPHRNQSPQLLLLMWLIAMLGNTNRTLVARIVLVASTNPILVSQGQVVQTARVDIMQAVAQVHVLTVLQAPINHQQGHRIVQLALLGLTLNLPQLVVVLVQREHILQTAVPRARVHVPTALQTHTLDQELRLVQTVPVAKRVLPVHHHALVVQL